MQPRDLQLVAAGTVRTSATVGDEPVRMYRVMTSEVDALIRALHAASTLHALQWLFR